MRGGRRRRGNDLGSIRLITKQDADKFREVNISKKADAGFTKISGVMDSGSIANVIKTDEASWVPIEETRASRDRSYYVGAGGQFIYNEGQKQLEGFTNEGKQIKAKAQVAKVTQNLWSVRETTGANNVVAFGLGDTHAIIDLRTGEIRGEGVSNTIVHKDTGLETEIRDNGKEYLLDMWIKSGDGSAGYVNGAVDAIEKGFYNRNEGTTFRRQPVNK